MVLFVIISFIAGSALGSFLGVLVDRLPRGEQVLSGRSKCDRCHRVLSASDLVPIFSYIALSGKCRYCHVKIPMHVFLTEVVCGIMAASLFIYLTFSGIPILQLLFLLVILFSLLGIFIADLLSGIIPDEFIAAIVVFSLFLLLISDPGSLVQNFITGLVTLLLFLGLFLITRGRGMGFGDVKFAFAMGFFLGFPNIIVGLYFAFLTAAAISIILILVGRKKLRGDTIVFGPFLATGTIFAYFFGTQIIKLFIR